MATYNAVQGEGVSLRDIATTVGKGLDIPIRSLTAEAAVEHFGPLIGQFIAVDMPASSDWTRKTPGWNPTGPGLIEDLSKMDYNSTAK